MAVTEQVLKVVQEKGPLLPVQVSKETEENILMTSARLAELLSKKQIKVSSVKVGGSPVYYFNGQEEKLQEYSQYLSGKEKEAYALLKEKQVLRDRQQDPAIRVALREIKDFSIPLQVNFENQSEVFWKWYLCTADDAQSHIRTLLTGKQEENIPAPQQEIKKEEPKPVERPTEKEAKQETLTEKPRKQAKTNTFTTDITLFFSQNKIQSQEELLAKKIEAHFIVELPTVVGKARFFCVAKDKKKIGDADLSAALIQAQAKQLPLLFLTTGELTKKAETAFAENFQNVLFKKI